MHSPNWNDYGNIVVNIGKIPIYYTIFFCISILFFSFTSFRNKYYAFYAVVVPFPLITYKYISSCRRSQSIMSFSSWLDIVAFVIYFWHSSRAFVHFSNIWTLPFAVQLLTRCWKELFKNFGNRKKAQT